MNKLKTLLPVIATIAGYAVVDILCTRAQMRAAKALAAPREVVEIVYVVAPEKDNGLRYSDVNKAPKRKKLFR